MTLTDALMAAGLTPPRNLNSGRWVRFPGAGKGRSNRSGWCRMISPTLAIFGDWSTGLSATWSDENHRDDADSREKLEMARARQRVFDQEQRERQHQAAQEAQRLLSEATPYPHSYLARKGFPSLLGLVHGEHLLVPVRDVQSERLISVQRINGEGEKKFLPGARVRHGVHRLGAAGKTFLCEGYATGLSVYEAARRLHRNPATVVCFSANNLEAVARYIPKAIVCADHDASGVGERVARATNLPWVMPPDLGDFNDLHMKHGIHSVVEILRAAT